MADRATNISELVTALARRVLAKQLPKMTDEERVLLTGAEKAKPRTFHEIDGEEAHKIQPTPGEEFGTKYHGYPDYLKLQDDPYAGLMASGKELPASASYADNEADIIHNMDDLFNNAVARVQAKKGLTTVEPTVRVKDRKKQADKFAADAQKQMKHDTYQKQEEATWNPETESYERAAGKYNLDDNEVRARTGNPDERDKAKRTLRESKPAPMSYESDLINMRPSAQTLPEGKASGTDILAEQYFLQGGAEGVPPMHLENTPLSQELADQRENVNLLLTLKKRLERGQAPYSRGQKYDPTSTPEKRAAMLAKRNWQSDDTKPKPGLDRRKEDKLSLENREANQEQRNLIDVWIRREQAKVEQLEKALMDAKE